MLVLNSHLTKSLNQGASGDSIDLEIAKTVEHPWLLFKACLGFTSKKCKMAVIAFGSVAKSSSQLTVASESAADPSNVSLKIPTEVVIKSTGAAMALQLIRSIRFELSQPSQEEKYGKVVLQCAD